jgi:hypothetical protein
MIVNARIKITIFDATMGKSLIKMPYAFHKKTPVEKIRNITNEISLVDLVLHVLITWGINAIVVKVAAIAPITNT